jgi:hypothetical protein
MAFQGVWQTIHAMNDNHSWHEMQVSTVDLGAPGGKRRSCIVRAFSGLPLTQNAELKTQNLLARPERLREKTESKIIQAESILIHLIGLIEGP